MRVIAITLCFARPDIVVESINNFHQTCGDVDIPVTHFIVDQHYPKKLGWDPKWIEPYRDWPDTIVLDAGYNRGLHGGHNWVINRIKPRDEDVIVCWDSDSFVDKVGWMQSFVNVLRDPSIGWATLMHRNVHKHMKEKGHEELFINGVRCWRFPYSTQNGISALKYGWIRKAGGMQEPRNFYGHFEAVMHDHMKKSNLSWVFLPDYEESTCLYDKHDNVYRIYKWRHSFVNDFPGDFESFLKAVNYTTAEEWLSRPSYRENPLIGLVSS